MQQYVNLSERDAIELYQIHKDLYYGRIDTHPDVEPISDVEFDELEQYLVDTFDFDKTVGADEDYGRHVKASHAYPMLSLTKLHAGDELTTENVEVLQKFLNASDYQLAFKGDGFGVSFKYDEGLLQSIVTRGNKHEGADITAKFRPIAPQTIQHKELIEIRAEFMLTKSVFKDKYEPQGYKHPRNAVVGIKNNTDIDDTRIYDISVVAVDAIEPETEISYGLDWIQNNTDFETIQFSQCNAVDLPTYYQQFLNIRSEYAYPTDGCVLSVLNNRVREHNGHHPNDMIAIKFPAPTFRTTVTDISWNKKRTGNLIPKIHFESIKVDGREIKQCSGFNFKFIADNDIIIGRNIEIKIAGDIIPYLTKVL